VAETPVEHQICLTKSTISILCKDQFK